MAELDWVLDCAVLPLTTFVIAVVDWVILAVWPELPLTTVVAEVDWALVCAVLLLTTLVIAVVDWVILAVWLELPLTIVDLVLGSESVLTDAPVEGVLNESGVVAFGVTVDWVLVCGVVLGTRVVDGTVVVVVVVVVVGAARNKRSIFHSLA